ncbi:DUF3168 domain-containing protein [Advenella sp. EE-W14]|uniref:tail completion protein gp17 n=1 Tax=Advenella sp. EE-W14 TaxID=2722705 RepID=UPI00145FBD93|nr:DUF3168 domain-containing protein [Advenella sp. EE-W14]
MIEPQIVSIISSLVAGRVYPDTAPSKAELPYVLYLQVGGKAVNVLEAKPMNKKNARFQIMVWAKTRSESTTLIRSIEDRLVTELRAYVEGASVSEYDFDSGLYGSRQDFSFWF